MLYVSFLVAEDPVEADPLSLGPIAGSLSAIEMILPMGSRHSTYRPSQCMKVPENMFIELCNEHFSINHHKHV